MTRHCSFTKKAAQWLSAECYVYDNECLRLYMRCEVINGSPDLAEVYRRGPLTLHQYTYEITMFLHQVQKYLAQNDLEKCSAEFELSFQF